MQLRNRTDYELIHGYQQGDEESFSTLFKKYYPIVFQLLIIKGIPQQDVEDLTAEIFIKLIESLKTYRYEKPFEHFLRRVVRNKLYDFFRKNQSKGIHLEFNEEIVACEPDVQFELEEVIEQCLQEIKSLIRRSIILLWTQTYKRQQIAEILNIPAGTVHSNLERGKITFRKCIQEKLQ
ncbi:MAG: RNA polymerase sigma factor [Methanosarcinaceae archaeon]